MNKTRVLVLAGGQSDEHSVSISSANSLLAAVADSQIEATPLVITREGRWLPLPQSEKALGQGKADSGGELTLHQARVAEGYDVVFPLLHGPHGEDGTIQGMLELAGIPYVGSGVLASAVCMDKVTTKTLLKAHGIPTLEGRLVTRHQWRARRNEMLDFCRQLRGPWFVKPANLGSSVGVSKATNADQLAAAIDLALQYDRRAMVEPGIENARELETAILGNDQPEASAVGEITYDAPWYDYETKYTEGRAQLHIPAQIPNELAVRIQELALSAFAALDCAGFARVDFFFDPTSQELYLNEVNTIPGFTPTSMYSKLWEHAGVPYAQLVERLVHLALERHAGP
jgi:D-alanine-D-alanine ligase